MDERTVRAVVRVLLLAGIALMLIIGSCMLTSCASVPTVECKLSWRGDCEQQLFKE